jgi:hypothetical protein
MQLSSRSRVVLCGIQGLLVLTLWSCGGDSDNGAGNPPANPNAVTIAGQADDGTPTSPLGNATCHFVDSNGTQGAQATTDGSGVFHLAVAPGRQGFISCTPPGMLHLALSTFVSTVGKVAGETIPARGFEEVSPRTTVFASLIAREKPTNPQARKEALFTALAAGDPTLTALVDAAVTLYQPLQTASMDVPFDAAASEGGSEEGSAGGGGTGDAGGSPDGGASGAVGDGAELSPIPNAVCTFALQVEGEAFVPSVLQDLFANGQVTRPDLQRIASQVNQALAGRAQAIRTAFAALFPTGFGSPLQTVATGANATYFLAVPAGLEGFVRCHPPNQEDLVLVTFVRARQAGETLTGQDVTPSATMFSAHIAPTLLQDLPTTQANYVADITGLRVGVAQSNGTISAFLMQGVDQVRDVGVSWVAFAATSLYASLFKRALNADYLTAMQELVLRGIVDPTQLVQQGVASQQAQEVADLVNFSINDAARQVGADPQVVLSTAHIIVPVTAQGSGASLPGVTVVLQSPTNTLRCSNCPATTNQNGIATLTLAGAPRDQAVTVSLTASSPGFAAKTVTTAILAVATVTVPITLSP